MASPENSLNSLAFYQKKWRDRGLFSVMQKAIIDGVTIGSLVTTGRYLGAGNLGAAEMASSFFITGMIYWGAKYWQRTQIVRNS